MNQTITSKSTQRSSTGPLRAVARPSAQTLLMFTQPPAAAGDFDGSPRVPANPERARPCSMRLLAVREHGRVIDFVWRSASNAAAHLLHCDPYDLIGESLRDIEKAGPLGHPALIERYRRVLEQGHAVSFEQVHVIAGRQEIVIHRVVPERDGVAITLTNLSANRRAQISRLQIEALQASLRSQVQ